VVISNALNDSLNTFILRMRLVLFAGRADHIIAKDLLPASEVITIIFQL
jgi:hypothetical protein